MATEKGENQFPSKMGPLSSYLCASRWPSTHTNSGLGATTTTKQKPYRWSWEEMIERMGEDLEQLEWGMWSKHTIRIHKVLKRERGMEGGKNGSECSGFSRTAASGKQRQEDRGSLLSSPPNQLVSSSQLQWEILCWKVRWRDGRDPVVGLWLPLHTGTHMWTHENMYTNIHTNED